MSLVPFPLSNIVFLKSLVHVEAGTTALFEWASYTSEGFLLDVALTSGGPANYGDASSYTRTVAKSIEFGEHSKFGELAKDASGIKIADYCLLDHRLDT